MPLDKNGRESTGKDWVRDHPENIDPIPQVTSRIELTGEIAEIEKACAVARAARIAAE